MSDKVPVDLIKKLRGRTGAGIGKCQLALREAGLDLEKAYDIIRAKGEKTAEGKADRLASEGKVAVAHQTGSLACVTVNCETDFVGKGPVFQGFADKLAEIALAAKVSDLDSFLQLPFSDEEGSVEQARVAMVGRLGENIQITKLSYTAHEGSHLSLYQHGGKIACGVFLDVDNDELGRDIAMHIVALSPIAVLPENVPSDIIEREKALFVTQTEKMGKPELAEKIVQGKLSKFLKEVCLLDQEFVKDKNFTIQSYLAKSNARVLDFIRVELGE